MFKNSVSVSNFAELILNTSIQFLESFSHLYAERPETNFTDEAEIFIQIPVPLFIFNSKTIIWKNKSAIDFPNKTFHSLNRIQDIYPKNKYFGQILYPAEYDQIITIEDKTFHFISKPLSLISQDYKIGLFVNKQLFTRGINYIQINLILFSEVLNTLDDCYFVVDQDFKFVRRNVAAIRYFETRGQKRKITDPLILEKIKQCAEQKGKIENIREENREGQKQIFNQSYFTFVSDKHLYVLGLFKDITNEFIKQKQTNLNFNLLQDVLEEANTAYLIFNQTNQLKSFNYRAIELINATQEIRNKSIKEVFLFAKEYLKESEFKDLVKIQIQKEERKNFQVEIKSKIENRVLQIRKLHISELNTNYVGFTIEDISEISYHIKALEKENYYFKILSKSGNKLLKTKTIEEFRNIIIGELHYIFKQQGAFLVFNSNYQLESYKLSENVKKIINNKDLFLLVKNQVKKFSLGKKVLVEAPNKTEQEIIAKNKIIPNELKNMRWNYAYIRSQEKNYYQLLIIYPKKNSFFMKTFLYSLMLQFNSSLAGIINNEKILRESQIALELNKSKSDFVSDITHEIKNPLSSLLGFSEILEQKIEIPKLKKMATIIQKSALHMLEIIQDLSDISKIESNTLRIYMEKIDIVEILKDIKDLYRNYKTINPNVELRFHYDENKPIFLKADLTRLKQIIINFLTNALKYTDYGYIDVGYKIHKTKLCIYVKDTGKGIPEKMLKKIFKRFERAENNFNQNKKGVGLGLSITQELANKMGAEIIVESDVNKGSQFSVHFNTLLENKNPQNKKAIEQADKKWVLVIDDDKTIIEYYDFLLSSFHINFKICSSALEAEKYIETKIPTIVFTDIRMAQKTGIRFVETNQEKLKNTKIYFITADTDPDIKEKALSLGIQEVIMKPISPEKIKKTLEKWI